MVFFSKFAFFGLSLPVVIAHRFTTTKPQSLLSAVKKSANVDYSAHGQDWGDENGVCNSRLAQSPISIDWKLGDPATEELEFNYPVDTSKGETGFEDDPPRSAMQLAWDGQAIHIPSLGNYLKGASVKLEGVKYHLVDLFVRSESEHMIKGKRYNLNQ